MLFAEMPGAPLTSFPDSRSGEHLAASDGARRGIAVVLAPKVPVDGTYPQ